MALTSINKMILLELINAATLKLLTELSVKYSAIS